MKGKREFSYIILALFMIISIILWKKYLPKIALKKYTEACLYLGYLDDEIARLRFEKEVAFLSRRKSLMYRYRLHLSLHKKMSLEEMEREIKIYERLLEEEKKWLKNLNPQRGRK